MDLSNSLSVLFQFATEGIVISGGDGKILKVNPSAEKLFGFTSQELEGQSIEVLLPSRYQATHVKHREKFTQNPHPRSMGLGMDLWAKRKDSEDFPVEISLTHYKVENETFVVAFIIDITLRKKAEEKLKAYSLELEKQVQKRTMVLREAINELENTKAELFVALTQERELNDLKSRFVSMASHEFRTPLSTILSSASLIGKYDQDSQQDKRIKHVDRIKSSVTNLTDILNDFLSLSRLEEGKIASVPVVFNLQQLVEEIAQEIQSIAKPGQKITFKDHCELQSVYSDKKLLRNILINLISNAIKFSPENSNIIVACKPKENTLCISVSDSGIGIPEEDMKHLFERFFRGKNATNIQGTGLGLNIVARYVDLLNGSIECKSELDKGTTFSVYIPKLNLPQTFE